MWEASVSNRSDGGWRRHATRLFAWVVGFVVGMAYMAGCASPLPPTYEATNSEAIAVTTSPDPVLARVTEMAPSHSDLAYRSSNSSAHTLDIYLPIAGGSKGTIVLFHKGGFYSGDKTDLEGSEVILSQLTNGFAVVSVNYTLATPEGNDTFPAMARDVVAAINWVSANGAGYGLNTTTLVAAGHSAGGTLAGWAGTTANSADPAFAGMPRIDGWISIAGILDWNAGPSSEIWGRVLHGDAFDRVSRFSTPAAHIDASDPPGYLIHGDQDRITEVANIDRIRNAAPQAELTIQIVGEGRPNADRGHAPVSDADAITRWINGL